MISKWTGAGMTRKDKSTMTWGQCAFLISLGDHELGAISQDIANLWINTSAGDRIKVIAVTLDSWVNSVKMKMGGQVGCGWFWKRSKSEIWVCNPTLKPLRYRAIGAISLPTQLKRVAMFSNFARWYFVNTDCIVRGIIRDSHQCELPCRFRRHKIQTLVVFRAETFSSAFAAFSPLSLSLTHTHTHTHTMTCTLHTSMDRHTSHYYRHWGRQHRHVPNLE